MAGHSKFKSIKHRKGAQDARRSKIFSRLAREIYIAAKAGADPESNVRLRSALLQAKSANMPKDAVERAIVKASGASDADSYAESCRGGFMFGVAMLIDIVTDSLARAHAMVKEVFNKHGVAQSREASVLAAFTRAGMIRYASRVCEGEEFFLCCAKYGGSDVQILDDAKVCYTPENKLHEVLSLLQPKFGPAEEALLVWIPKETVEILDEEKLNKLFKFQLALEELDDVERVTTNLVQGIHGRNQEFYG
jgi:YebC/PmpR family DNA-binding regulatory protein